MGWLDNFGNEIIADVEKLKKGDIMYYLIDLQRTKINDCSTYWKGGARGYTTDIEEAGLYDFEDAKERCDNDRDKDTVMLPMGKGNY